jgi:hypothetical protein
MTGEASYLAWVVRMSLAGKPGVTRLWILPKVGGLAATSRPLHPLLFREEELG